MKDYFKAFNQKKELNMNKVNSFIKIYKKKVKRKINKNYLLGILVNFKIISIYKLIKNNLQKFNQKVNIFYS